MLAARDGEALAEIPASGVSFSSVLTGEGAFECALPFEHPSAGALVDPGAGREIAVIREDGGGARCVWNGPLISTRRAITGEGGTVTVAARTPGWYLSKRVTEGARAFRRPVFAAVSNLVDMAQGINRPPLSTNSATKHTGALYRFDNSPRDGGPEKAWTIGGADRLPILDVIADLADDDAAGFDYRWEYGYQPTGHVITRTMRLGAPTLGTDRAADFRLEIGAGLTSIEDEADVSRAANRVHVLGAGTGGGSRRANSVNTGQINASGVLLEEAVERTNVASQAVLDGMARAYRRQFAPATRVITATFVPTPRLPYGFADVGDTIRVRVRVGSESVDLRRRIVAITTTVDDAGLEEVALVLNNPLDEVVT